MSDKYNVISSEGRRDIREVEKFAAAKTAKWGIILTVIIVTASVVSLTVWQPWATKQRLENENTARVNSPQVLASVNAQVANLLIEISTASDAHASALENRVIVAVSQLRWDQITPGNQAGICTHSIAVPTADC
jgi:hypothetical protein